MQPIGLVFVCTGNICRSPFAELYTRSWAEAHGRVVAVSSAGTAALVGDPMDPTMARTLDARPGSQSETQPVAEFRARQLGRASLVGTALVLTAQRSHQQWVLDNLDDPPLTMTLGQYARAVAALPGLEGHDLLDAVRRRRPRPLVSDDVPDPYRGGAAAAAQVAEQISGLLDAVLPQTLSS